MKKEKRSEGHLIRAVEPGSIADELGISAGDRLLSIDGRKVVDIFDYRFLIAEEELTLTVVSRDGEEWDYEIEKDADDDLGLTFENGLMDEYRSCRNHCIFCFIDQMPKGMRETLYFKDDDSRLSFLQGNYVTLTNLSDEDIDRITRYHMSPINISFHTTDRALRCQMLGNRFAGEALDKVDLLIEKDPRIELNGQIVLCKGINDGERLRKTIGDLMRYLPNLRSLSVVPVGLTRFREGLYPLEPFTKEDALETLSLIEHFQELAFQEYGIHFVHASDEWYLLAGRQIPKAEMYDGYLQLENGVGMLRLLMDSFAEALEAYQRDRTEPVYREISCVTGRLIYPTVAKLAKDLEEVCPSLKIHLYEIRNDFFGERITVTGLLTGQDIIGQLKDRELGEMLLLPDNLLRADEDVLLDDVHVGEIEKTFGVPVGVFDGSGEGTLMAFLGHPDGICRNGTLIRSHRPQAYELHEE
ncbi:MAG: DUF512 domain-containing protein [Lachnospiraceae bacterium]|nr:DUF512 domain-containing protein [Lachnospiraceae bacterium]